MARLGTTQMARPPYPLSALLYREWLIGGCRTGGGKASDRPLVLILAETVRLAFPLAVGESALQGEFCA